ncbi:DUF2167 domain-containing protein [Polaromonas sp.]|uniref:DUF2167 domain-containing protein n=1 Tax=Polaromonas sp. TaxID=1869339 RepID=UPI003267E082
MSHLWTRVCALALVLSCSAAVAQPMSKDEAEKIWTEARTAAKIGPQDIPLADQAVLKLPAGRIFVPQPEAARLLNAMGNPGKDTRLQGLVFPAANDSWFVTVRFESAGYVKDDDAKDWNADDLLKSYREGTEASNSERKKMGVPEMEIVGWAEKPAYNAATHRLVWAMSSKDRGAAPDAAQGVNYNTYALGREGYFSLNLVTALKDLPKDKPVAAELLSALQYNDGKRYADFNSKTDKVAEYGLAALVLGVAAKKLGFFAVAALFLAKFAKVIFLAVAGFGAVFMKYFKRKPAATPMPVAAAEQDTIPAAFGSTANAAPTHPVNPPAPPTA